MNFVYLNPSLKDDFGSDISFFRYLLVGLNAFGVKPLLCAHREVSASLETELHAKRLFRFGSGEYYSPAASGTATADRFASIWQATLDDLKTIQGVGPNECFYLSEGGLCQLMAVVRWIKLLKSPRPKIVFHLVLDAPWEAAKPLLAQIASLFDREMLKGLKLISFAISEAESLSAALDYPVELWPRGQDAITQSTREAKAPAVVAFLGHQTAEKGYSLVPAIASSLLSTYPGLSLLVHNNRPQDSPAEQDSLRQLAGQHQRLVLTEAPVPDEVWKRFLEIADVIVIPASRDNAHPALLHEAIANGIPAVVPVNSQLSETLAEFGMPGRTFAEATPSSILAAIADVLANYSEILGSASLARRQWLSTQGSHRIASRILSWFPVPPRDPQTEKSYAESATSSLSTAGSSAAPPMSQRILVSWYCDPSYIPPPIVSTNQVTVGPHPLATASSYLSPNQRGRYDAHTPFRLSYDLQEYLEMQGISGPFDLVIVFAEATMNNLPCNVHAFGCPALLFAGDTHYGETGIQKLTAYARTERFDYVLTTYNRQHLHWYGECGIERLAWIPALSAQSHPRPVRPKRRRQLAFSGQSGNFHVRRDRLVNALRAGNVKVEHRVLSREATAELYNCSTLSFNASLNGDLNLRTFEVMSAGGCLVSDRLSPESGQSLFFEEGRDFLSYSSPDELVELVKRYLEDQTATEAIASAGQKAYQARFRPEALLKVFSDWISGGVLPHDFSHQWDVRPAIATLCVPCLPERMAIYGVIQEIHRLREDVRVLVSPQTPLSVIADMIDLPRLECHILARQPAELEVLKRYGLLDRVTVIDSVARAAQMPGWACVIGRPDEVPVLQAVASERFLQLEVSPPAAA